MAITLTLTLAPGATPILPNQTPEQNFLDNLAKLSQGNISAQDRNSIAILGLVYALTAAGGANYKANLPGLIQDSVVFSGGVPNLDLVTARAVNSWNAGKVADAALSTDVPTLLATARLLAVQPALTQERIIAFLRAQLRT